MLILQNISYPHPNKDLLFENLYLTVNRHDKIALTGNNGTGKSTLLKLIANELLPSGGQMRHDAEPYFVPQHFGQYDQLSIAQALRVNDQVNALNEILNGNASEENFALLNNDWNIEERCKEALKHWQLKELNLSQSMGTLSGGQKTKVLLAGISIHEPELVLLDEPSNHLDISGRQLLYEFIQHTKTTLLVVSHDKKILNLLNTVCELSRHGITIYGGNYDFYTEQKAAESNALHQDIHSKEKALRKAREKESETLERQQRLDARGKRKQEKAGMARIMMNTLRNKAENSTAKLKSTHSEKISDIADELQELRVTVPDIDNMKFDFDRSALHKNKLLFSANNINFTYGTQALWQTDLNLEIKSGERVALKGTNGSGKTTLIKLILGELQATTGHVYRADARSAYIDQDYSLINNSLTVYEQAQQFNSSTLQEHEIKTRLNRFLFTKESWEKPCIALSGGERLRLTLCCLNISSRSPDLIVLDEPTNNLDIQNVEILAAAINSYQGTLIVVSHDEDFLKRIHIEQVVEL